MKIKTNWITAFVICSVAILFSFFAFYNGYPMLYPGDSWGYFHYGKYLNHESGAHAFIYGLLVGGGSFHYSLWFAILFQCLICSTIFIYFLKSFLGADYRNNVAILFAILIVFTTSFSKYAGKILPDVFGGISLLLFWIYLFNDSKPRIKWFLIFSICVVLGFHTSFILIYLLVFILLFLISFIYKDVTIRKKAINGFLVSILAILFTSLTHLILLKEFYFNKASHAFTMAKIADYGILQEYLNEYCETEPNELCGYKEKNYSFYEFLWDNNQSPIYKGFENNNSVAFAATQKKYNAIILNILSKPKYLIRYTFFSIRNTGILLSNINKYDHTGDITEWGINHYLPNEKRDYYRSRQVGNRLKKIENYFHGSQTILVLATIIFLALFYHKIIQPAFKQEFQFTVVVFIFIVCNCFVCAFFSEADSRFTERVIWLVPLCLLFFGFKIFHRWNFSKTSLQD